MLSIDTNLLLHAFNKDSLSHAVALDWLTPSHDALWQVARSQNFASRRHYDACSALTMTAHGVTDFATANVKVYEGFALSKVCNPLAI